MVPEDKVPVAVSGPPINYCKIPVKQSYVQVNNEYRKRNHTSYNRPGHSNINNQYFNRQNQNRPVRDNHVKLPARAQTPIKKSITSERERQDMNIPKVAESENDFLDPGEVLIDLK